MIFGLQRGLVEGTRTLSIRLAWISIFFTFVHCMLLRPLVCGEWELNKIIKSYDMKQNQCIEHFVKVAAGRARAVPVPMLHIGAGEQDGRIMGPRRRLRWRRRHDFVTTSTSGCGFAALQRCLRIDEMSQMSQMGPDGTRWDQMGPDGTRDRPWRPWALEKMTQHLRVCKKIESFSSKPNRDHPDINPMSFLLLFLALDDQVNLCESESSEYICLNKKQPQTGERLNTCAHVNTWRRYSVCHFRVWLECSCLQLIKCATWDAATSSVEKTKSQSHAEHWQHMNSSTNAAICCRVMFMSFT